MKQRTKRTTRSHSPLTNEISAFRKAIHSGKTLRKGLSIARAHVEGRYIPAIVKNLSTSPHYSRLLVQHPFPKHYSQLDSRDRLDLVDIDTELIWTASVLSLYIDQLENYVQLRKKYEHHFILSQFEEAWLVLAEIEDTFGVSMWLISNRLQLLQIKAGLHAQKEYLEEILASEGLSQLVGCFAYYLSLRAEENISFPAFESEVKSMVELSTPFGDYALFHLLPYDLTKIRNPAFILFGEETLSIVDRFQSFVRIAQLLASAGKASSPVFKTAIDLIASVNDPGLQNLRQLLLPLHLSSMKSTILKTFDDYTEGRYESIRPTDPTLLELTARAQLLSPAKRKEPKSIAEQVVAALANVILNSDNFHNSRLFLQKCVLMCAHHPASTQIAAFLERTHDYLSVTEYSQLDRLCAIAGDLDNPWSAVPLYEVSGNSEFISRAKANSSNSSSLKLQSVLHLERTQAEQILEQLPIPEYRKDLYRGHLSLRFEEFPAACHYYRRAREYENLYLSSRASAYLFKALFAQGLLADCLDLVVDHCLENSNGWRFYPIEPLIKNASNVSALKISMSLAILLHIAARQLDKQWERDLSDAYENVLFGLQLSRPTGMKAHLDQIPTKRAVYFLRHICVLKILDDSTSFDDVTDIEEERIAICQMLIELDPMNKLMYSEEIRTITRDAKIANLLKQVQASMIYVDEDGIKNAVEVTVRNAYERFQGLLNSPQLEYQADSISRKLEKLLADKSQFDMKDLRLPASEKEGLFTSMLDDFVSNFASNPAYGLDTHLSSSIRHGTFEGHVKSPFARYELLSGYDKKKDEYVIPSKWRSQFSDLETTQFDYIAKQMGKFTARLNELVTKYLTEYLHVNRGVEMKPNGMFNFFVSREERMALMNTVTSDIIYDELINKMMAFSWNLTDRSMKLIRADLSGQFGEQINQYINSFIGSLDARVGRVKAGALIDALVRARSEFHVALENICEWFLKPTDLRREPFEFELAIEVALKQVENCYVTQSFRPSQNINVNGHLPGEYFDGMVEIIFVLLQNVIRHSGFKEAPEEVEIEVVHSATLLTIEVRNKLNRSIDLGQLRLSAQDAVRKYDRDTAIRLARQEGGSGLSKVWRVVEFDFKKNHQIELEILPAGIFRARLVVEGVETLI